MKIKLQGLALLLFVASSCAIARQRENEPIAATQVESIEVGDPAGRVTELLGAPAEVVQLGQRTAYLYDFTQAKSAGLFLLLVGFFNQDTQQDRVWVFFDEDQNVSHVGATFEAEGAEYGMPWSKKD